MRRSSQSWWTSLPKDVKEKFCWNDGYKPHLNQINYIRATNLIEGNSKNLNPTVEEILDWVITVQDVNEENYGIKILIRNIKKQKKNT